MEDLLKDLPFIGGAGFVGTAVIVFWRLFLREVREKEFWRAEAVEMLKERNLDLDTAEKLVKPLKKVERIALADRKKHTNEELLAQIAALLPRREG